MLFPTNDRNWGIAPTKKPQIRQEEFQQVMTGLQASGQPVSRETLEQAIRQATDDSCKRMADTMEDQLEECDYDRLAARVIENAIWYGTGSVKGPMAAKKSTASIQPANGMLGGSWFFEQVTESAFLPSYEHVAIWYFYPDML